MKSRKQSSGPPAASSGRSAVPSATQRWVFRALAVLSPVLLVAVVEVFLRISGYGYPTSFFLKQKFNGREVLIENWRFGWRFFPKEIARTPEPVMFSARKAPGTIRIFVFGESAAMGDPEPAFGLPRMLQALLELKFPSNRFEVINVAMTAINSHVIREIAKDCAPLEGDVWIIYMGNNEVVGPFGSGTVFTRQVPALSFIRASLWLKEFRIVQWISSLGRRGPVEWEGMEMFLKQQVQRDDPRMEKVYRNFQRNLDDIVRFGGDAGAKVVLSTVAVNLKDCPPFASKHTAPLNETERQAVDELFPRLGERMATGGLASVRALLSQAKEKANVHGEDHFAQLYFHLGELELALGSNDSAQAYFNLAKEFDTLRFRADDRINEAIRKVALARSEIARLVEAGNALSTSPANAISAAESFCGIPPVFVPGRRSDSEFFYEHVHLTFAGNYLLARAFLDEFASTLPAAVTNRAVSGFPTMTDCARRLAWTDWDRLQVFGEVRKRLQRPPFAFQYGHAARDAAWTKRIDELEGLLTTNNFERVKDGPMAGAYVTALQLAPEDWVLHENFAKFLETRNEFTRAMEQWQDVQRLLPHDASSYYHIGNLLDMQGRSQEALGFFRTALARNPGLPEKHNGLALALENVGQTAEAEREFNVALRINARFTEARVNLGQLLAQQGRVEAAIAQYERALKSDTNSAAAHVNLGKLLNQRGDKSGALSHYEAALRINPKHAVAHYNLGNLLRPAQPAEAARHFDEAVRAKPDFADAHVALATELAQSGNAAEAEKHFTEAIRLQPGAADAHFNYGVALANQRRFREAAKEFSQTLALQPGYPNAREFLDRAERMK